MAWSFYYQSLRAATDDPPEPLDPYDGCPMKKAPRDTLTNKQLRKMGKKAFVTSFHLPDRNHDIGTHKRIELVNSTERRINEVDPMPPAPKPKYKPFVTAFHIKRPDEMRMYAMKNYSLSSTDYLEFCRDNKVARSKKKKKRVRELTGEERIALDEERFEEALAKELEDDAMKIATTKIPVPKLAWTNDMQTESHDDGSSTYSGRVSATSSRHSSAVGLRKPPHTMRSRSHSVPVVTFGHQNNQSARNNTNDRQTERSSSNKIFFTEIPTSRMTTHRSASRPHTQRLSLPSTFRTKSSKTYSSRMSSVPETTPRKQKTPLSYRSTSSDSSDGLSQTMVRRSTGSMRYKCAGLEKRHREFKIRQMSPKSRSRLAWSSRSKRQHNDFDVNPSLSDWER